MDLTFVDRKKYSIIDIRRHEMSMSLKTFLSYDRTCNLWCPSCRPSKETVIGEELDQLMDVTTKKVIEILKYAHSVMLNGYGDLFASKVCRHIMRSCDDNFPNLKYDIITNAVLFTEDITDRFPFFMNKLRSNRLVGIRWIYGIWGIS